MYELAGGEQQRVMIARILLKPCELVLADEPSRSLDAANRYDVTRLLVQMNAGKRTIVLVTHDPQVAVQRSRVIELDTLLSHQGTGHIDQANVIA